LFVLLIAF
jgi:hypothetical protein